MKWPFSRSKSRKKSEDVSREQDEQTASAPEAADADVVFESRFADLENDDPDIRAEARRLLADDLTSLKMVIHIYQECLNAEPRRASLAGRVLGYKIAKGSDSIILARFTKIMYGVNISFIPCMCGHCGHLNRGIAAPANGPMVAYYGQDDDEGAYATPVLCDKCGREFFVAWDRDPR